MQGLSKASFMYKGHLSFFHVLTHGNDDRNILARLCLFRLNYYSSSEVGRAL